MEANSQPWLSSVGVRKALKGSRCGHAVRELTFHVERPGCDRGQLIAGRAAPHTDPRSDVLVETDTAIDGRAMAFEELPNSGLEILREEIRGGRDVLKTVVLLLVSVEQTEKKSNFASRDLAELII